MTGDELGDKVVREVAALLAEYHRECVDEGRTREQERAGVVEMMRAFIAALRARGGDDLADSLDLWLADHG